MFRIIKSSAILMLVGLLNGCITHSASLVSDPLQPASGEPVAYLVGSIGPVSFKLSPADNQRLLIRKRGSAYGAAGLWMRGGNQTPQDIEDGDGAASVFVLPLKPGDYEFYDFQFFSTQYTPGLGTTFTSRQAREKFNLPLRLEARPATSAADEPGPEERRPLSVHRPDIGPRQACQRHGSQTMRTLASLIAASLLTGCTATNTLPDSTLADGQDYLQPIHVMVDDPMQSSILRNHLRETGVFRNIETGSGKAGEYSVQIKLNMQREYPPFPVAPSCAATSASSSTTIATTPRNTPGCSTRAAKWKARTSAASPEPLPTMCARIS